MTRRRWTLRTLVATAAVGVVLTGCGSDAPSPEQARATLVAALSADLVTETDGALDDAQAACVAAALVDTVGIERLDALTGADVLAETDEALRTQVIDAFAGCDALAPLLEPATG